MDQDLQFIKGKMLSARVYPEFFPFQNNDVVINLGCGLGPQVLVYSGNFNKMIGIDINEMRLKKSMEIMEMHQVDNYQTICANVESVPLEDSIGNKILAIDIIEHVQDPRKMCLEANRLLNDNGLMLVTFPTLHDKYQDFFNFITGRPTKKHKSGLTDWDPDDHNQEFSIDAWIKLVEECGFKLEKSKATTLFPPLHLYGLPRFWFSNNLIHKVDSFFCELPGIKNYGQALMVVFSKK